MAVVIPASVAPALADALQMPVSLIGLQVSFAYIGATSMSLFAGLITRRFGAVRTSQIAAGLIGASLLVIAVPEVVALAIGSLGIGIAYGLTNPAASHVIMKIVSDSNRNFIFSIKQTGQPLGGVVAGLMAPPLAVAFGWQWSLVAGAALAFVTAIAIQPLRKTLDADREPQTRFRGNAFADIGLLLRTPKLRLLSLSAMTYSGVQLALMTYAVTMLVEELTVSIVIAGIILAILQIAGVLGRLGWGALADRFGRGIVVLFVSQVLTITCALMTTFLTDQMPMAVIIVVMFCFGTTAIGWNGIFMAEIARMSPEGKVSSATGGVLVPTFLGVILGPLLFSGIHSLTGSYTATFGFMALLTMLGLIPLIGIMRREAR